MVWSTNDDAIAAIFWRYHPNLISTSYGSGNMNMRKASAGHNHFSVVHPPSKSAAPHRARTRDNPWSHSFAKLYTPAGTKMPAASAMNASPHGFGHRIF